MTSNVMTEHLVRRLGAVSSQSLVAIEERVRLLLDL